MKFTCAVIQHICTLQKIGKIAGITEQITYKKENTAEWLMVAITTRQYSHLIPSLPMGLHQQFPNKTGSPGDRNRAFNAHTHNVYGSAAIPIRH